MIFTSLWFCVYTLHLDMYNVGFYNLLVSWWMKKPLKRLDLALSVQKKSPNCSRNPPPTSLFSRCFVFLLPSSRTSYSFVQFFMVSLVSSHCWMIDWKAKGSLQHTVNKYNSSSSKQTPGCVNPWKVSNEDTCVFSSLLFSWCWIKVLWGSITHVEPQKTPVTHYRLQKPAVPKESLRYYHTRTETVRLRPHNQWEKRERMLVNHSEF